MGQYAFGPTPVIAAFTRRLQATFPQRPLKGLTRLSNWLSTWLPAYQGVIQLPDGVRMMVDSNQPAERWLLYSGNYQPALTHILRQQTSTGAYCLDIGANLGFYTLKFARWVGATGQVAAFEANPAMVDRIKQNVALNDYSHVDVVSVAIHNQPGSIEFYVSSSLGKSSVNQIDNAVKKITVPAITIDRFVAESAWTRLDVIKIDIEGNDCNALLGAHQTLERFRSFVVFEYKRSIMSEIAQEACELLTSLGYQLWSLSPRGKRLRFDWQTSTLSHSDIICIPAGSKNS